MGRRVAVLCFQLLTPTATAREYDSESIQNFCFSLLWAATVVVNAGSWAFGVDV